MAKNRSTESYVDEDEGQVAVSRARQILDIQLANSRTMASIIGGLHEFSEAWCGSGLSDEDDDADNEDGDNSFLSRLMATVKDQQRLLNRIAELVNDLEPPK